MHARHARRSGQRWPLRRAAPLAPALALALLVSGTTAARLSATESSSASTISAGSVTLTASAISGCPVTGLLPDNSATACSFTASYSGASAYLALNVLIETQAGTGGSTLYNPADASNDLQVSVTSSSPSATYSVPTVSTTCPGSPPPGSTCYELDNELVQTAALTSATVAFSASVKLPVSSTTSYQNGTAQIIMTAHAVQSKNNTLSCTTTPAAGSPCTPAGSFSWS